MKNIKWILAALPFLFSIGWAHAQNLPEGFPVWKEGAPICYKFSDRMINPQVARASCLANEAATQRALAAQWLMLPQTQRDRCAQMANSLGSYVAIQNCIMLGAVSGEPQEPPKRKHMVPGWVNIPGARYYGMVEVPDPTPVQKPNESVWHPYARPTTSARPVFTPAIPLNGGGPDGPAFEAPPPLNLPPTTNAPILGGAIPAPKGTRGY